MERKIILVDFDGVVGEFDRIHMLKYYKGVDKIRALRMFVHLAGVFKQSKEFKRLFNNYQSGKYTQEGYLTMIGASYPTLTGVAKRFLDILPSTLIVFDETLAYLDEKIKEGYEIYIVTNNMPENVEVIEKTMKGHCNGIIYSTVTGYRKDHPEMFEKVKEETQAKEGEIKLFLDDKSKFVEVAEKCGIPSMTFDIKDKEIYEKIDDKLNAESVKPEI
ncbi:MAG: hypothetical protein MJ152_01160 [Clostridia bacterium]|nr:hypothetical protein [Clostridia bacterium]